MNKSDRLLYPTPAQLTGLPGQWPVPLGFVDREVVMPEDGESQSEQQVKPSRLTGLSVRLVVAPDLTVVGLKNFTRPGTNVGLLAEYQLTPRWSFQAGVLRSSKIYRAATSDYNWMWPVQPESVSGRCNMLDIPLNLRYDVALRPPSTGRAPSRWFVSGGVTTYVMLREDFTYNYANPADPRIKYRQWSTKTGRYEFSHLNLSAGYERSLSRRLAWQVEPFLKIPLKEVGYFKLNLISTGAFFSLRYRF
ncbi:PorT family protein [Spirosoma taeanense]|uniref:PorT family protein n=1 Tax=Spirosoma taeanense TaxID=2735870 RepID=A0A6M5Y449_9BACT|nr:outer membrane beta-barrel protein [Spirosoma taeanense]QJW88184.1 PorT family protein [Spirosoma taeanense]